MHPNALFISIHEGDEISCFVFSCLRLSLAKNRVYFCITSMEVYLIRNFADAIFLKMARVSRIKCKTIGG